MEKQEMTTGDPGCAGNEYTDFFLVTLAKYDKAVTAYTALQIYHLAFDTSLRS